jgi:hypothetical protein
MELFHFAAKVKIVQVIIAQALISAFQAANITESRTCESQGQFDEHGESVGEYTGHEVFLRGDPR